MVGLTPAVPGGLIRVRKPRCWEPRSSSPRRRPPRLAGDALCPEPCLKLSQIFRYHARRPLFHNPHLAVDSDEGNLQNPPLLPVLQPPSRPAKFSRISPKLVRRSNPACFFSLLILSLAAAENQCQVFAGNNILSCYPTNDTVVPQHEWNTFVCTCLHAISPLSCISRCSRERPSPTIPVYKFGGRLPFSRRFTAASAVPTQPHKPLWSGREL